MSHQICFRIWKTVLMFSCLQEVKSKLIAVVYISLRTILYDPPKGCSMLRLLGTPSLPRLTNQKSLLPTESKLRGRGHPPNGKLHPGILHYPFVRLQRRAIHFETFTFTPLDLNRCRFTHTHVSQVDFNKGVSWDTALKLPFEDHLPPGIPFTHR
jgi:hypothetical protein